MFIAQCVIYICTLQLYQYEAYANFFFFQSLTMEIILYLNALYFCCDILYWTSEKTSISLRVQELSLFNFVCMYSGNNESSGLYNYTCLMGSGSELVIGLQFIC